MKNECLVPNDSKLVWFIGILGLFLMITRFLFVGIISADVSYVLFRETYVHIQANGAIFGLMICLVSVAPYLSLMLAPLYYKGNPWLTLIPFVLGLIEAVAFYGFNSFINVTANCSPIQIADFVLMVPFLVLYILGKVKTRIPMIACSVLVFVLIMIVVAVLLLSVTYVTNNGLYTGFADNGTGGSYLDTFLSRLPFCCTMLFWQLAMLLTCLSVKKVDSTISSEV